MAFKLEFETDNAAFDEEGGAGLESESVRILRLIASQIERGSYNAPVLDVNGNRVGNWFLERPEPATVQERIARAWNAANGHGLDGIAADDVFIISQAGVFDGQTVVFQVGTDSAEYFVFTVDLDNEAVGSLEDFLLWTLGVAGAWTSKEGERGEV